MITSIFALADAYKYNGKELQETGMYAYGWRQYMPDIARWNGMDQLSEKFISSSPYAYVMNNPAMFFDPDGRDIDWNLIFRNATPNAETTYSDFDSNGKWRERSFVPFGKSGTATAFYNFIAGGGTGSFTYWTGGAMPSGSYTMSSDGLRERGIQGSTGHNINIKGNSNSSSGSFLNDVSTVATYTGFGAGATLGLANDFSESLVSNGKMIKSSNILKTYNLYRTNGALNGNQYISGAKFLSRAGTIGKYAKFLPVISFVGVGIGAVQSIEERHPGYLLRSMVSATLSFVPYVGPFAAYAIDQSDVDIYNAWTLSEKIQREY